MCRKSWDLSVKRSNVRRRNLVATRIREQQHLLEYATVRYALLVHLKAPSYDDI